MYRSNENESVFTWAAPPLKFGIGALDEVGAELSALGSESCLVITTRAFETPGSPTASAIS